MEGDKNKFRYPCIMIIQHKSVTRDVNLYSNLFHLHRAKVESDVARLRVRRHTKNFTSVLRWPAYRNDRAQPVYCHENEHDRSPRAAWQDRRRISPDRRVLSRMKGIVFLSRKKVRRVSSSSIDSSLNRTSRHFYEGKFDRNLSKQWNNGEISAIISRSSIGFRFVRKTFFLENKKKNKKKRNHPFETN